MTNKGCTVKLSTHSNRTRVASNSSKVTYKELFSGSASLRALVPLTSEVVIANRLLLRGRDGSHRSRSGNNWGNRSRLLLLLLLLHRLSLIRSRHGADEIDEGLVVYDVDVAQIDVWGRR